MVLKMKKLQLGFLIIKLILIDNVLSISHHSPLLLKMALFPSSSLCSVMVEISERASYFIMQLNDNRMQLRS